MKLDEALPAEKIKTEAAMRIGVLFLDAVNLLEFIVSHDDKEVLLRPEILTECRRIVSEAKGPLGGGTL